MIVKSCRKKEHCQHPVRMEGRRWGDDEGTTALLLPARLHSLSSLSSFPPLSCFHALPSPRLWRPPCQSPFHPLARFSSALLTHDVLSLAVFPLGFGDGRETLVSFAGPHFPCWLSFDYSWRQTASRCLPPSPSLIISPWWFSLLFLFSFACSHPRGPLLQLCGKRFVAAGFLENED